MSNSGIRTKNKKTGDLGEEIACRYLRESGYALLNRNYWRPWGEIDIVAELGEKLCFFEVKTAVSGGSRETVTPETNLHSGKLQRFDRIVQSYLWEKRIQQGREWAFQAILVLLDMERRQARVEVVEDL